MQRTCRAVLAVFALGINMGGVVWAAQGAEFTPAPCEIGVYGSSKSFVSITRDNEGFAYAFSDGRRGQVGDNAEIECGAEALRAGKSGVLSRTTLSVTSTNFASEGTRLAGQLLEPSDANGNTPLVVLAHGSEETGWIETAAYPYQLAGRGVSVFVYDKRGTGLSDGQYSQNFTQLADDLVAASTEAKRLAEGRYGRFGLLGFSQGGWIAPLASARAHADFLGIAYGLLIDILEEDAAQVELELREAGFGDDVIEKAKTLTDVTARLAVSSYSDGLDDLDRLRDRYRGEAWFPFVRGGFSGVLLGLSTDELRDNGVPMFDRLNIDWSVKPMNVLRDVDVPLLWVLAEDDREAPISATLSRLQTLRQEGKDITVFLFPGTDHGMWEYEQSIDGMRTYTRITDRYYDLLADWSRGLLSPPYADSSQP